MYIRLVVVVKRHENENNTYYHVGRQVGDMGELQG